MKGYLGKILAVDLSTGKTSSEKIKDDIYEKFLSGVGLGAYYLYKNIPANADPLGPGNILGFLSGLLTGTGSVVTGRWMAVCKSPLTGGWGDANCGGNFSPAIKRCGYDAFFFKGISKKPVYLYVDDKKIELRNASHIWGKDAVETEKILIQECKTKRSPAVACIGQAGENLSLIAGIVNDSGRIAARSGVGAVMGSKKLKAVVLNGSLPVKCNNPEKMKEISREFTDKIKSQNIPGIIKGALFPIVGKLMSKKKDVTVMDGIMLISAMKKWGTIMNNTLGMPNGDSPVMNWKGSVKDYTWKYYKNINPDYIIKREIKKYNCFSCPIGCGGICDIKDIKHGEFTHTHKPEYETCCSFGSLTMNKDLDSIFYINELLNRAGMDSISVGCTVAFALECFEKGIITKEDTGGLELTWGNSETIIELVKLMIGRKGIGKIFADGIKKAAQKLGQEAKEFAVSAGGQEPGMHDPKMDPILGIHFSADPTPGRHTIGGGMYYTLFRTWDFVSWAPKVSAKYPKKEEYEASETNALKAMSNSCVKMLTDGSGGCLFAIMTGLNNWKLFDWLDAATGWNKTPEEYMEIGHRIQTLRQMFNIKHGIKPIQYKMHDRISGHSPLKQGPLAGISLDIEKMMKLYWKVNGWDEKTGSPKPETRKKLSLAKI